MKKLFLLILITAFTVARSQGDYHLKQEKVDQIKTFVKNKNYSQRLAFFIDFRIPSNYYRFFIVDLEQNKILEKAIVSHGSGSEVKNSDELVFSNTPDSYQSSLGKYKIAESYVGSFGKSYRLVGLDKSNSKAMQRAIVLHPYDCIGDKESAEPACLSLGCPMLSPKFFKVAAKYIDASQKPIILYAFY